MQVPLTRQTTYLTTPLPIPKQMRGLGIRLDAR